MSLQGSLNTAAPWSTSKLAEQVMLRGRVPP